MKQTINKVVGDFHVNTDGNPKDCIVCQNAQYGSILINGVCSDCLYDFWRNFQNQKEIPCPNCGETTQIHKCAGCGARIIRPKVKA